MDQPAPPPAHRGSNVILISLMYCCTGLAEATSTYIMPDAIHRFTQNAFFISIILSFNALFGFVAQPWAGWYSDRIWTPLGRRIPLILVGAFCLALSCAGLPFSQQLADRLPWLAGPVRGLGHPDITLGLVILAFWILVYQFMVDVISIMVRSIIGDVVPHRFRARTFAATNVVSGCMVLFTTWVGGGIAKGCEWKWYALVAAVALAAVLPATFLLKEPYTPPPKKSGGQLRAYATTMFQTPHFFRMCLVVACTFVAGQLFRDYYRLFTKEQLGLNIGDALQALVWMPIVMICASVPVGWLSDRLGNKYVTIAGVVIIGVGAALGLSARTIWDLRIMSILVGIGSLCVEVASNPYLITFMPPGKIGQMSGFANIFRGGPRFLMFFTAGALIEIFDRNYRIAFAGSVLCALTAVLILWTLPKQGRFASADPAPDAP